MHEPIASLAAPSTPLPVIFSGRRGAFTRMVLRGGFLELLTLGFYRFWLTTDMRRHLWAHTSVGGDPAEYTGRARELLIGFLIAMAILVPIYVAFFLLTLEAERLQAFASLPLGALLYVLVQYAIYRARRYRVTRTVWRGLRFSMGGSGWGYALRGVLWGLLTVITLGIAWPWRTAALERYKMRHAAYGSLQGEFAGTGMSLFKRVWYFWFVVPAYGAMFAGATFVQSTADESSPLFLLPLVPAAGLLLLPFFWAAFRAIEWRWWVSNIRFGDVQFESRLASSALIGTYWKVIGWSALITVLLGILIGGASAGIVFSMTGFNSEEEVAAALQHPSIMLLSVAVYLVAAIAVGAVIRLYLMRDIWAKVANTTIVHNLAATDNVAGQGVQSDALGEGFADGLDIGGF